MEIIDEDDEEDESDEEVVESDAFDVSTDLATDEEGEEAGKDDEDGDENDDECQVDNVEQDVDDQPRDDKLDKVEVVDNVDEIAVSDTDSENEATLVGDGSFGHLLMQSSFDKAPVGVEVLEDVDTEELLCVVDDVVKEVDSAHTAVSVLDPAVSTKLNHPLDRLLVSLTLCASLAIMDWAPRLVRPWTRTAATSPDSVLSVSAAHRGRWVAVLLLLVWIPVVH